MAQMTEEELDLLAGEAATKTLVARAGEKATGFIRQFVKPAVLPTGLGIAGAAFGGGVGTPFGLTVPGGVAGGAAGSAAGEALNQALGITEPSLGQIGIAAAIPAAVGTAAAVARPLARFATAARAAQTLNALAPDEAAARLARLTPRVPAKVLFKQATEQRVLIPATKAAGVIDDMLDDLTRASKGVQRVNSQVIGYLKGLKAKLESQPAGVSPAEFQRELEGAGQVIKSVGARGGSGSGAVKKVFNALIGDLDEAAKTANPAMPAASTLIAARDTFKRESVIREIGEMIQDATKLLRGQGGQIQFNANQVIRDIGKNKFYADAFTAAERKEVESLLKLLNNIPALRPGAGAQFGSGRVQEMLRLTAVGGAGGAMMGGGSGGAIGAAAGAMAQPVLEFGRNFATALQMQTGRALLRQLLTESKGVATPQVATILAAYARSVEGQAP